MEKVIHKPRQRREDEFEKKSELPTGFLNWEQLSFVIFVKVSSAGYWRVPHQSEENGSSKHRRIHLSRNLSLKSEEKLHSNFKEKILRIGPYEERRKGGKEENMQRTKDKRERISM